MSVCACVCGRGGRAGEGGGGWFGGMGGSVWVVYMYAFACIVSVYVCLQACMPACMRGGGGYVKYQLQKVNINKTLHNFYKLL